MRKYNWKKGNEIICTNNYGHINSLSIGKKYIVNKCYREYGAYQVDIFNDNQINMSVFCSRFTTFKEIRKEKLKKLKNIL